MQSVSFSKPLPKQVRRPEYHRIRVMKSGDPPKYVYSSESNTRFDLIHLSTSRIYAEYYQYTPGSVFNYDFDKELIVMKVEGKWFAYYTSRRFWDEHFSI